MTVRPQPLLLPLVAAAGALAAGALGLRAWLLNWGATAAEARLRLPGDELISDVAGQSTMAITIDAPPAEVWPWLVQMGVDRAGFYTYLFIENTLLRLGVTNADHIVPAWQALAVGDHLWFTSEDYPTPRFGPVVTELEPHKTLVLVHGELDKPAPGTWQFVLVELPEGRTRLLLRERRSAAEPLLAGLPNRLLQPGYFVMDRGMLRGIRRRAEQRGTALPAADLSGTTPPARGKELHHAPTAGTHV
jgi:hypothetical protein